MPQEMPEGTGDFYFQDRAGLWHKPIHIWYHRPAGLANDAPIVFVMHGMRRNAAGYREPWIPLAEQYGFVLVAPQFSDFFYPTGLSYNLGGVTNGLGQFISESKWTFSAVEHIFDEVKGLTGNTSETYYLYGHSAGGQFVHRVVLLKPDARIERAVAANAGWYTMPAFDIAWPYGLKRTPVTAESLAISFQMPMTILLGEQDTNTEDPQLSHTPGAMAQGPHRLARGQAFCAEAELEAERLGTPLGWDLETVPGVGHSNGGMAPAAARAFFEDRTTTP